jgi:hypothetical protein
MYSTAVSRLIPGSVARSAQPALALPHDARAQLVEFSSYPSARSYDLSAISVGAHRLNRLARFTWFRKGWFIKCHQLSPRC